MLIALIALVSLVVTYIGAAVGLVLGHLRLLLLVVWLGPLVGAATSLAISSVGALVGALRHAREGRVEARLLLSLGLPSALSAFATATLAPTIDPHWLEVAIAVTLLVSGAAMVIKERRRRGAAAGGSASSSSAPSSSPTSSSPASSSASSSPPSSSAPSSPAPSPPSPPAVDATRGPAGRALALEVVVGCALGALSGVVGLLLGTLRLPVLLRIARTPAIAVGTNMAIGAFTGLLAGIAALREATVDPLAFAVLAPVTVLAAHFGARTTGALRRETLVALIAWILVGSGLMMGIQLFVD